MLGYFAVTVIHWIQTWTTGALTCLCDLFARVCAWWPQFMSPNCTDFQSGEISGQVQSMWWSPIHLMTMFNHVQLQLSRASARNSQSVPLTLLCPAFKYDTLFSWGWSGGGGIPWLELRSLSSVKWGHLCAALWCNEMYIIQGTVWPLVFRQLHCNFRWFYVAIVVYCCR